MILNIDGPKVLSNFDAPVAETKVDLSPSVFHVAITRSIQQCFGSERKEINASLLWCSCVVIRCK